MYFIVLHGIAQIPVWEAQNQARNGLKRTCIRHIRSMHVNEAAHITVGKTHNRVQNERK